MGKWGQSLFVCNAPPQAIDGEVEREQVDPDGSWVRIELDAPTALSWRMIDASTTLVRPQPALAVTIFDSDVAVFSASDGKSTVAHLQLGDPDGWIETSVGADASAFLDWTKRFAPRRPTLEEVANARSSAFPFAEAGADELLRAIGLGTPSETVATIDWVDGRAQPPPDPHFAECLELRTGVSFVDDFAISGASRITSPGEDAASGASGGTMKAADRSRDFR
jgi:hypothetical protein